MAVAPGPSPALVMTELAGETSQFSLSYQLLAVTVTQFFYCFSLGCWLCLPRYTSILHPIYILNLTNNLTEEGLNAGRSNTHGNDFQILQEMMVITVD